MLFLKIFHSEDLLPEYSHTEYLPSSWPGIQLPLPNGALRMKEVNLWVFLYSDQLFLFQLPSTSHQRLLVNKIVIFSMLATSVLSLSS